MKWRTLNLNMASRIAFVVIIVFVLLQVFWWLIFQNSYIRAVSKNMIDDWNQDASVATAIFLSAPNEPRLLLELKHQYPELTFDANQGVFVVNQDVKQAFMDKQNRILRMFAFEGPFFIFIVLAGLYVIGASLKAERELKRRQGNFLGAISHEFKTPISTLRLLLQTLLLRDMDKEKRTNYIKKMEAELSRLEQTSEQVLASARLEQNPKLALETQDINELTKTLVEKLRPGLEMRGAKLKTSFYDKEILVALDKNSYSLILSNLLDNAVKYSPSEEKPIEISVEIDNYLAMVKIRDYGVGIDPKDAKNIFNRFYRVGNEMTRSSKGVGLGLYLVKSLTERMNGWIKLDSEIGKGSQFSLTFPRRLE